ncbi:L-aspartate oxidase [Rubrobacter indicoceani]|uniref:L-aspartate oxidase n=1 Tax=Rubrobacter indicoceani TaxID=2051957 RepID=UPI000E5AFF01|nr:FAD-dependent oxidoreductase [Rubrobacter indicoceani]
MQVRAPGYDHFTTDVLIIGAGAAGLRAAIELSRGGVDTLVVGKSRHGDAHTIWAAGGVNASLGTRDPEDSPDIHAADTIGEGHYVTDPQAVAKLAYEAPERIRELQDWGCRFSLTEDGEIDQRYFGAQSFRRTCFAGDRTGEAMLSTLVEKAKDISVPYRENVYITKLLTASPDSGGHVNGAAGYDLKTGRRLLFSARAVVIAAGGLTSLYERSSSRRNENNGDAMALAYDAGAALRDMEFVQFHPTGMVQPEEMAGMLVTEAVRGEGGRLYNAEGERFMEHYSPDHMELDARDVVARANYREIQAGRGVEGDAVLLDISHRDADYIKERLPKMYEQFSSLGVDITREPMKVSPTAHYAMGGIKVDFDTMQSTVRGLYTIGEATAGVHGANRLGGNSLAETVVFGKVLGEYLTGNLDSLPRSNPDEAEVARHFADLDALGASKGEHDPNELVSELRRLVWDHAGIVRTEKGLDEGLRKLAGLKEKADSLDVVGGSGDLEQALNLRSMLTASEAILRGARLREESRGAHHREDFELEDPDWQKTILCAPGVEGMQLWNEPIGEIPQKIQKALDEDYSLDYHHLE